MTHTETNTEVDRMAKQKVYELAKELGDASKDLITLCEQNHIEVKNHMSTLEEAQVATITSAVKKVPKAAEAPKAEEKAPAKEASPAEGAKPENKAPAAESAEAPKKKKNIIFVSNPHNSKMPGQSGNQGNRNFSGGNGQRPAKLRETDVIADGDSTADPVQGEPAQPVAGGVVLLLTHGGEQMGLIVRGNAGAFPVKNHTGIVDLMIPQIGHRAGNDIHMEFFCQRADPEAFQVLFGKESGVPGLRQHDHIAAFCRSLPDQLLRMAKILLHAAQLHIHLQTAYLHFP